MKNIVNAYVDRFQHERKTRIRLACILAALAAVVTVVVFWQLHNTGVAMTNEVYCGMEEHQHDDSCYEQVLVCGYEEGETVVVTPAKYETEEVLACGMEESEEHTHTADCYKEQEVLVQAEVTETHHHTADCYEKVLTCTIPEHTHSIACMIDETADVETKADWEATLPDDLTGIWADDVVSIAISQIGYTESTANFELAEDGVTRKGYTRYGAWYGNKYGDWCAMFASFCLHYAGIPDEDFPEAAGVYAWTTELEKLDLYADAEDYTPVPGDLIFFDNNGDGKADHVGIVESLETETDEETGEEVVKSVTTIEGNSSDKVKENTYEISDSSILGYGVLPEQDDVESATLTYEGEDYTVTVTYGADAELPEDVELSASEYEKDSETFQSRYEEAAELYGWEEDMSDSIRLFDVTLYSEGEEVEPAAPVQVTITYTAEDQAVIVSLADTEANDDAEAELIYEVIHFGEETEQAEAEISYEDDETVISFKLDSFSDVMVVTVTGDEGPHEDWDETVTITTDSITITKVWADSSDADEVRPTSVTFNLINRTFYESEEDYTGEGTLEEDTNGYYDPDEDVIVATVVMLQSQDTTGTGDNTWVQTFNFDNEITYNVFEEETYGASFYTHTLTETELDDGKISYTVTNTLNTSDVIFDITGQGSNDGRTLDDNYVNGHYYHIDVRVDSDYTYTYYGGEQVLVDGTDLNVTKSWITGNDNTLPESVTFYVYEVDADGDLIPLYYDEDGLQTTEETHTEEVTTGTPPNQTTTTVTVKNEQISVILSASNNWKATLALDGGNYALVEQTPEGYSSDITYITIDESAGEEQEDSYYVYTGSVKVDSVNWVLYTLNDNDDSNYAYYQQGLYEDYTYGRIDGDLYTSPDDAQNNETGDYEFFLDNGEEGSEMGNEYGGRGLYYLTEDSTIWVNLDYSYTYTDQNGAEQTVTVYGYSFEFTPEEWMAANLCTEKDEESSQRGVDLYISGDTLMGLILDEDTRTEIDASAANVADDADTVYLQGRKYWLDEDGRYETNHDNAEEITLKVYRTTVENASEDDWTELTEGTDYVVNWVSDVYYIYASGEDGVFVGLPATDDSGNTYYYKVEEESVEGYSSETTTTTKDSENTNNNLYGTSYNFTNTAINDHTLTIQKVDSSGNDLDGATFTLERVYTLTDEDGEETEYTAYYKGDEEDPWVYEYGENFTAPTFTMGSITLESLHDGTYTLTEVSAPDGYNILSAAITFTVEDGTVTLTDGTISEAALSEDGLTLTVTNLAGAELPETGGIGTRSFTAGGLAILAFGACGLAFVYRRRKNC